MRQPRRIPRAKYEPGQRGSSQTDNQRYLEAKAITEPSRNYGKNAAEQKH